VGAEDLPWMRVAYGYLGQREIKGTRHNPLILKMWTRIRAPFTDDETPWCAAFVGSCLEEIGLRSSRSAAALSYNSWGMQIPAPVAGCIAVKRRYNNLGKLVGGHVGFVAGRNTSGKLIILGGNQNNAVTKAEYHRGDFHTFRWPAGIAYKYNDYPMQLVSAGIVGPVTEA